MEATHIGSHKVGITSQGRVRDELVEYIHSYNVSVVTGSFEHGATCVDCCGNLSHRCCTLIDLLVADVDGNHIGPVAADIADQLLKITSHIADAVNASKDRHAVSSRLLDDNAYIATNIVRPDHLVTVLREEGEILADLIGGFALGLGIDHVVADTVSAGAVNSRCRGRSGGRARDTRDDCSRSFAGSRNDSWRRFSVSIGCSGGRRSSVFCRNGVASIVNPDDRAGFDDGFGDGDYGT